MFLLEDDFPGASFLLSQQTENLLVPDYWTGIFSSPARYVRVRYLHIRVASYWQSPKLAPSEGQA